MSNLPAFLQVPRPTNSIAIFGNGDDLSPAEIDLLHTQVRTLHFHPIVAVLPKQHHVKDGDALVAQLSKTWGIGPHGILIVYSPADKDVWVTCGTFNSSAGVDPAFFKRDFMQRMPADSREGNLYSALNASLQDVDRVIVRSQAYATHAVNNQMRVNHHHSTHAGGGGSVVGLIFPIGFAIFVLYLIGKAKAAGGTRRVRFDDPDAAPTALDADVERIMRITHGKSGQSVRTSNTQVPMAEFKKRAGTASGASTAGAQARPTESSVRSDSRMGRGAVSSNSSSLEDQAAELQSAIDASAAQNRHEAKQRAAEYAGHRSEEEEPVLSAKTTDVYVASFGPGGSNSNSAGQRPGQDQDSRDLPLSTSPYLQSESSFNENVDSFRVLPNQFSAETVTPKTFAGARKSPNTSASAGQQSVTAASTPTPTPIPVSKPTPISASTPVPRPIPVSTPVPTPPIPKSTPPMLTPPVVVPQPGAMPQPAAASLPSAFSTSLPVAARSVPSASEAFNDSFAAGPFANMMTNLGSLESTATAPHVDIDCPKCSEPKSKDFSFCLKCGHNF